MKVNLNGALVRFRYNDKDRLVLVQAHGHNVSGLDVTDEGKYKHFAADKMGDVELVALNVVSVEEYFPVNPENLANVGPRQFMYKTA